MTEQIIITVKPGVDILKLIKHLKSLPNIDNVEIGQKFGK